ncbi:hypothetical protein LTR08_004078 [Meristemomyces frigidus]|nr:hypothetical protein LTR08_004078 [Meristemomyces frigidus]
MLSSSSPSMLSIAALIVLQGRFESTNVDLHKKYGPIVRLAPNRYSIADPSCVRAIYGIGSKFSKSDYYHPFGNPDTSHKDIFSERSNEVHSANRRKQANMYSMTSLKNYEPFVDRVNSTFFGKLKEFSETGQSFDLFTWMQFYAFDVIGEITIGRTFGMLEAGNDKDGLLDAVDFVNAKYGARLGHLPELHVPFLWLAQTLKLATGLESVTKAVEEQIALRKSGESVSDRADFLGKSLDLIEREKLDRFDLFNVVATNIGAGSDTTAISATAIIYYLMKNPKCMRKLRKELDDHVVAGELSETATFQEGQRLEYLQAVIKEALRLHPAVGMPLARVVPPGGATLAGQFFPENVRRTTCSLAPDIN